MDLRLKRCGAQRGSMFGMVPPGFDRDAYLQKMIEVRNKLGLSKADIPFYAPHDPASQLIMTKRPYLTARTLGILSENRKEFLKIPQSMARAPAMNAVAFMHELTGLLAFNDEDYAGCQYACSDKPLPLLCFERLFPQGLLPT